MVLAWARATRAQGDRLDSRVPRNPRAVLSDLLTLERVKVPLAGQTRDAVLRELVRLAMPTAESSALGRTVQAVLDREALLSTGIGSGIAIPHGRTSEVDGIVLAAGRTVIPVDFDAHDGRPVSLFFLLLCPESAAGAHVRALGRISRVLRHESVRDRLNSVGSSTLFLETLIGAEVP